MTRAGLIDHIRYCHEAVEGCKQAGDTDNLAWWESNKREAEELLARRDAEGSGQ